MRRLAATLLVAVLALSGGTVAACEKGTGSNAPGQGERPPDLTITAPTDGAKDVPASTEIAFTSNGGATTEVTLADAGGTEVAGAMRPDGSAWLPGTQLEYATTYTATIVSTGAGGARAEARTTFTTMARPNDLVDVHSWIGDDQVVGVGMPIVITFGLDVPDDRRDDVQRRLFVRSDPPQQGAWHWFNAKEVHFRPREHWQPGTKLDIRIGTGGLPWGVKQWYGRHDLTVHASVGPAVLIEVDNKTKRLTVTKDGKVLRTIPVSLGKPASPSSSGNLLVMVRSPVELFDSSTYGVPVNSPDGYRTRVQWAMRLTWSGEFIHAAPWSVADQGRRNVSHGCVNLSTSAAKWVYDQSSAGVPVTVRGTERHVVWGDGWTDWDRPWEEYVKGSALPVE